MATVCLVLAVLCCAETFIEKNAASRHITICSDSQTAFSAVKKPDITTELVCKSKKGLNQLSGENNVTRIGVSKHTWQKRHSKSIHMTGSWIRTKDQEYWERTQGYRQAKAIVGYMYSMNRATEILILPKKDLRIVVHMLIRHNR